MKREKKGMNDMPIVKLIFKSVLDTLKWGTNIMFGSIVGYFVVLRLQDLISLDTFYFWVFRIIFGAILFNIGVALIYKYSHIEE